MLQKISDPVLTVCPACGQTTYLKQVTAAGFQLKGSGWYVTDFRGGDAKSAAPASDDADKSGAKAGDAAVGKPGEAPPAATPRRRAAMPARRPSAGALPPAPGPAASFCRRRPPRPPAASPPTDRLGLASP